MTDPRDMSAVRVTFPCPDSLFQNRPPPCTLPSTPPLSPTVPGLSPLSLSLPRSSSPVPLLCALCIKISLKPSFTVGFTQRNYAVGGAVVCNRPRATRPGKRGLPKT